MNKKYLIFGGVAVILGMGVYLLLQKDDKNKDASTDTTDKTSEEDSSRISKEQKTMDVNLMKVQPKTVVGKKVYSKIDDVSLRLQPFVNNGIINNEWSKIPDKNTLIGVVKNQATDSGKMRNSSTNKPYIWYLVELNEKAWNTANDLKSIVTKTLFPYKYATNKKYWIREDTIKI